MERKTSFALIILALLTGIAVGTWGQRQALDRIIARVGDTQVIMQSELEEQLLPYRQRVESQLSGEAAQKEVELLKRQILDALIEQKLIQEEAEKRGIPALITPDQVNEYLNRAVDNAIQSIRSQYPTESSFNNALAREGLTLEGLRKRYEELYRSDVRNFVIRSALVQKEVQSKVEVTDEDVERYYRSHKDEFSQSAKAKARIIYVRVKPDAGPDEIERARKKIESIRERIAGGADFAEMARKYSEDVSARAGGDVGYIERGTTVPEFESVVFGLKPGEVSFPIRTYTGANPGFYLVKVEEIQRTPERPLEEVAPSIRDKLRQERLQKRYTEWVAELRKKIPVSMVAE
ncbi:MAG: peptidylprolyl isomerase [bacterium]